MKFLNNKKPKKGWRFRLYKINVAVSHYLSGKIARRHNEELWTYLSKNPEMFEEVVIREKMDKALKSGEVDEVMDHWDKFAEIMNMDTDQLKTDEKIDEALLGSSKVFKDISRKLQEYKDKTGNNTFPWKGYIDQNPEQETREPDIQKEQAPEQPTKTRRLWSFYKQYATAAIVLFVISMGISAYFFLPGQSNDKIYDQFYNAYQFKAKSGNNEFSEFILHYQNNRYRESRQVLDQIGITKPYDHMVKNFYMGISYLGSGDFNEATGYLQRVIDAEYDSGFKDHALWYQGLAYLKLNKENEAYRCFSTLKQREIPNKNQVKKVIWKLR